MSILEIRDISFSYKIEDRAVRVLKGLNLRVEPGELIAIQGSSGSGKSTLLYILGCLLKPDAGKVILDGQDVSSLSNEELAIVRNRTIGFVFQQFHLLARASVVSNILLPTRYPCETARTGPAERERAAALARELGLGGHLENLPNQLSGGQQQRVAIARALMNDVSLILADEPTGNLDTQNASQIIELLKELNRRGKTVIIITHDPEVARHCARVYHIRDGAFTDDVPLPKGEPPRPPARAPMLGGLLARAARYFRTGRVIVPVAWENLRRNKARSALTMLGITIGIASVLAMLTLGQFVKRSILGSYEAMGVNKIAFHGWSNWNLKATDKVAVMFREFDWDKDLKPLLQIMPNELQRITPVLFGWNSTFNFGGRQVTDIRVHGVGLDYAEIHNHHILLGNWFTPYQIDAHSGVCVLGFEVAQRLFVEQPPLGQMVYVQGNGGNTTYTCRVIGVLQSKQSNDEWNKPNLQVFLPFTFFRTVTDNWWDAQIHHVAIQANPSADIEKTGAAIKAFFEQKYGKSGRFSVDNDAVMVEQMRKFLNLFAVLLGSIALISLGVGGIGITNMMLVSVTERFKEIGLRKAIGATDFSIRVQLLMEALLLCGVAGILGVIIGFTAYEGLIYGASKLVTKLKFEWLIDPWALLLSFAAIIAVGIASGLAPALRAERLEVIEALRSE